MPCTFPRKTGAPIASEAAAYWESLADLLVRVVLLWRSEAILGKCISAIPG
jgi:hypothetical protein